MNIIYILLALIFISGCSTQQSVINDGMGEPVIKDANIQSEEQWYYARYDQLSRIKNISGVKQISLERSPGMDSKGIYTYCPSETKGLINFDDKTWIIIISHSSHYFPGGNYTLIRASNGKYYQNKGHACEPIVLFSKENINSLESFLRTVGTSSSGSEKWNLYEIELLATPDGFQPPGDP